MNLGVANSNVWDGGVLAPPASYPVSVTLRLSFGLQSSRSRPASVPGDLMYYGRVRTGALLDLELQCVGGWGAGQTGVVLPDSTPMQRIYAVGGGPARTAGVPVDPIRGGATGVFRGTFRPGSLDPPGHYLVLFLWTVLGKSVLQPGVFEVIPSGHPAGAIMATTHDEQPAGGTLIAHHEAGLVMRGLRPYLDPGD